MAELHVQHKRGNYLWFWLLLIVLIAAAAAYLYVHYYQKNNQVNSAKPASSQLASPLFRFQIPIVT